jgi:hypothetical protein
VTSALVNVELKANISEIVTSTVSVKVDGDAGEL